MRLRSFLSSLTKQTSNGLETESWNDYGSCLQDNLRHTRRILDILDMWDEPSGRNIHLQSRSLGSFSYQSLAPSVNRFPEFADEIGAIVRLQVRVLRRLC